MKNQNTFKTSAQLRRENLSQYIKSQWDGRVNDFAESIGRTRQQVYKLLADPKVNAIHKPIGPTLARDLEKELNLTTGYLDQDHALINASEICQEIAALTGKQQKALKALIKSFGDVD